MNSIRQQRNEEFRSKYRTIDVLIVDDIQFIAGKTSSEEEFFSTLFNSLFLANKQIVISSDRPPKELHTLEERLRTRFESGLLVDIQPPDFETRAAILKQKAEQFNLDIDYDLITYIASNINSNVRELEGTIKKITALTGFSKRPVTLEIVENALADFNVVNAGIITPSTIITLVEKHFNLKENSLVSSKRSKDVAFARHIAMYIMRELTEMSTPKIGQELGGRDHSTVFKRNKQSGRGCKYRFEH
ncbi:MAG: chromosomal replication initiator protein DnaA [Clostridiales bacterium]|nr:MAG: chromosomal replication initiator protein DnaA [Clostridiales bacterium]